MILTCSSGHRFDTTTAKYIGPQEGAPGEWLDLFLCPTCTTTVSGSLHLDACKCLRCGELVMGTVDDPKIVACQTEGASAIACAGCARFLGEDAIGPEFAKNREVATSWLGAVTTTRRRAAITLGEVRAEGG